MKYCPAWAPSRSSRRPRTQIDQTPGASGTTASTYGACQIDRAIGTRNRNQSRLTAVNR